MKEPKVSVGIMFSKSIRFKLTGAFVMDGHTVSGEQTVSYDDGKIAWNGQLHDELLFDSQHDDDLFSLHDVVIGINFHWERKEDQTFQGSLKFIVEEEQLTAVNLIGVEDYLTSVITSEMRALSSKALLEAHAVISRSWLLAQIEKQQRLETTKQEPGFTITDDKKIVWYDREDHVNFDVCADDHCQRYQGVGRLHDNYEHVKTAIDETRGQVLYHDNQIADARFYKCCGGALEEFSSCWEDKDVPYLVGLRDDDKEKDLPNLTQEAEAVQWIQSRPAAFCDTTDPAILSQVLNNYDQETEDFYRWQVEYGVEELSALIRERSGIDFGTIQELIPVRRGVSARLIELKIVGSKKTMIIGKELEIRRTLSKSHLYSSAFYVEKQDDKFILHGAGWGHGAGLCQIGAAVMGDKGYAYDEILYHYYPETIIKKIY